MHLKIKRFGNATEYYNIDVVIWGKKELGMSIGKERSVIGITDDSCKSLKGMRSEQKKETWGELLE